MSVLAGGSTEASSLVPQALAHQGGQSTKGSSRKMHSPDSSVRLPA